MMMMPTRRLVAAAAVATALAVTAAVAVAVAVPVPVPLGAAACNGHDALCGRRYSNITFIGSHNSAFVGDSFAHNQFVSVTEQLDGGVRFLQAQTHNRDGEIELCHSYCWELDVGPLLDYLREVAAWLDAHPDNVVTLLLTNGDAMAVDKFDAAFADAGLKTRAFRPPGGGAVAKDQWPTLRQLLDAGTRLVVFMDYHADQRKVDYILNEFEHHWETPYGITERDFPTCAVDRPPGGDAPRLMGIMNHMLNYRIGDIVFPAMLEAADTNSLASIQRQVDLCLSQGRPQPNVVLLDWVDVGEAQKAHQVLNALS